MSAYVCSSDHIAVLAAYAVGGQPQRVSAYFLYYHGGVDMAGRTRCEQAYYFANVLYQENIRSVSARYPDDSIDNLPGPIHKPAEIVVEFRAWITAAGLKPVAILKMCDCLEYQSCETDDYRQTPAFALLDAIRGAAIRNLAGYEDAPWEFTRSAA